jgi:eukaryotic-like serine/threonine-protein kinase
VLSHRATPREEVFGGGGSRERRRRNWIALVLPVGAGVVVLALLGWLFGMALGGLPNLGDDGKQAASAGTPTGAVTKAPPVPVTPTAARLYDPRGDQQEARGIAEATDGDPDTAWRTAHYKRTSAFGGLKPGIGIAYDFGKPTALRQVEVSTAQPGIQVQIRAGDTPDAPEPDSYQVVGATRTMKSTDTFSIKSGTSARYYIVWLTQLVPDGSGEFLGSISEVAFRR